MFTKKGKQGTHWHQTHMSLTQTEIYSFLFCQAMTEARKESKNKNKKSRCEQQRSQQVMKNTSCLALRRFGEIIDVHHSEKGTAVQAFNLELFLLFRLLCMPYVKCHNFPT